MAGQMYSRYIRPATNTVKTSFEDSAQSPPKSVEIRKSTKRKQNTDDATERLERGREKKKRKALDDEAGRKLRIASNTGETGNVRSEQANRPHEEDIEEESLPKRHKSILSKFERSARITSIVQRKSGGDPTEQDQLEGDQISVELHGKRDLEPIPQPEEAPDPEYKPSFSALPSWLAQPETVPSDLRKPFSELQINKTHVDRLTKLGYKEAFAVQSGLIPRLLPGSSRHMGDVCVSAATGSGKTLAYVLPLMHNLRDDVPTALRAVIVVPTRELVAQARKVALECAAGTSLKIGIAVGHQSFAEEQKLLVRKGMRYDPSKSDQMRQRANHLIKSCSSDSDGLLDDLKDVLPGHIPTYSSSIDILICTPGRLVEHINATKGFNLYSLQYLIIDEADRLLDQSFQEWASVLLGQLESEKPESELTARERVIASLDYPQEKRPLTKIILSATMTRDLAKLSVLKLRRPMLLVVEDSTGEKDAVRQVLDGTESFELPSSLEEVGIAVGDGSKKPLFLLQLLQQHIVHSEISTGTTRSKSTKTGETSEHSDTSSDSESDSESVSSSDLSDSSSSSGSDVESESDSESSSSTSTSTSSADPSTTPSSVLIFTNNNENAARLSHVLSSLRPDLASVTAVLTKSSASSEGRKALASFSAGKKTILIASDRASRGLDVPNLSHIVNYDMPRSVVSYVHRVGRTARAGKVGHAWTFVTKAEGRWFWNDVAKGSEVQRGSRTVAREKLDIGGLSADVKARYAAALEELRLAVAGEDLRDTK